MGGLTPAITAHRPRGLGPGVGVTTAIIIGAVPLRDTGGPFRRTLTAGQMLRRRPMLLVRGAATARIEKSRALRSLGDEPRSVSQGPGPRLSRQLWPVGAAIRLDHARDVNSRDVEPSKILARHAQDRLPSMRGQRMPEINVRALNPDGAIHASGLHLRA